MTRSPNNTMDYYSGASMRSKDFPLGSNHQTKYHYESNDIHTYSRSQHSNLYEHTQPQTSDHYIHIQYKPSSVPEQSQYQSSNYSYNTQFQAPSNLGYAQYQSPNIQIQSQYESPNDHDDAQYHVSEVAYDEQSQPPNDLGGAQSQPPIELDFNQSQSPGKIDHAHYQTSNLLSQPQYQSPNSYNHARSQVSKNLDYSQCYNSENSQFQYYPTDTYSQIQCHPLVSSKTGSMAPTTSTLVPSAQTDQTLFSVQDTLSAQSTYHLPLTSPIYHDKHMTFPAIAHSDTINDSVYEHNQNHQSYNILSHHSEHSPQTSSHSIHQLPIPSMQHSMSMPIYHHETSTITNPNITPTFNVIQPLTNQTILNSGTRNQSISLSNKEPNLPFLPTLDHHIHSNQYKPNDQLIHLAHPFTPHNHFYCKPSFNCTYTSPNSPPRFFNGAPPDSPYHTRHNLPDPRIGQCFEHQRRFLERNPQYLSGYAGKRADPCAKVVRAVAALLFVKNKESQAYPCLSCGQAYKNLPGIKRHLMSHLNIKPYKCESCSRTFSRIDVFKRHEERKKCDRPGRKFKKDDFNSALIYPNLKEFLD